MVRLNQLRVNKMQIWLILHQDGETNLCDSIETVNAVIAKRYCGNNVAGCYANHEKTKAVYVVLGMPGYVTDVAIMREVLTLEGV